MSFELTPIKGQHPKKRDSSMLCTKIELTKSRNNSVSVIYDFASL